MDTNTKITIAAVAGLSIGTGIGYFVAEKRLKTKYEAIAEAEIADMQEMYEQRQIRDNEKRDNPERKAPPTEEELNKAYTDSILAQKLEPSAESLQKARDLVDYRGYFKQGEEPETVETVVEDPRPVPQPEEYTVADNAVNNRPYVISVEMYMANDENYDQICLTYYQGDNTLVDDADKIIDDVNETINRDSLNRFGEDSGDPNTVYVRNEQREADYEIILDERRFGQDILGMIDLEDQFAREPKPRPKRFRDA